MIEECGTSYFIVWLQLSIFEVLLGKNLTLLFILSGGKNTCPVSIQGSFLIKLYFGLQKLLAYVFKWIKNFVGMGRKKVTCLTLIAWCSICVFSMMQTSSKWPCLLSFYIGILEDIGGLFWNIFMYVFRPPSSNIYMNSPIEKQTAFFTCFLRLFYVIKS